VAAAAIRFAKAGFVDAVVAVGVLEGVFNKEEDVTVFCFR
jgi:hypothetical protein